MIVFNKARLFFALGAVTAITAGSLTYAQEQSIKINVEQSPEAKNDSNDIDMAKISESFGNFIGRNLKSNGIEFNLDSIIKGMREGAAGKPAPLNEQEYEKMMTKLQEKAFNSLADTNLKSANEFLSKNTSAAGVVEIIPGKLQYTILEKGHDPVVQEHGSPLINYTGKYIDGSVFGSSEEAGGPITIPLDQTIPGFSKGLVGMKEGEKRRLFVHPEMGYGRAGHLAPNSLLIFDIEIVKATSPEKADDESVFDDDDGDLDDDLNSLDDKISNQTSNEKQEQKK
jgi:peptidylprolyl isomerase